MVMRLTLSNKYVYFTVRVKHENILLLFFIFSPLASFASNENVDHVFIKAQAAVASSLCTDVANVSKDTLCLKELEPLIKMCRERRTELFLTLILNAAHT